MPDLRLRPACLLAVAGLLVACFAPPALPAPASPHAALLDLFDTVLQRVVTLRHLTPTRPIKRGVRDRQHMRLLLRQVLDREYTPAEWAIERKALHQWGLLPADFPLKGFVVDLLVEQVAGYYDPHRQQFFLADWLPAALQAPIIAHELVHALQDQHYDLQRHFAPVKDHADLTLARQALVEGDALAVMFAYMLQPHGLSLDQWPSPALSRQLDAAWFGASWPVYDRAPPVLKQQLLFPYRHGFPFIQAALSRLGWHGLQQLYRQPPVSTEQILHPEKYFSHPPDLPQAVPLPFPEPPFPGTWHKLKGDVLGEFLLSVVLQQFLPTAEARPSAAGWRGDRYALFEHQTSGDLALISVITWDTHADAVEFFQSYAKLLGFKYPDWTLSPHTQATKRTWRRGRFRLGLSRQERCVLIVEGVPAATLAAVRRQLCTTAAAATPARN